MNIHALFWFIAAILVGAVGIRYHHNAPLALVCAILWVIFCVIAAVV